MPGLFQVRGRVHPVPRITQAAQDDGLQDCIVFDQKNAHGGNDKKG